ncbi:MAG: hypothetical protein H6573_36175, partial [Lewinellaceae bacterium]|nr:hypothetical protein [Lewinellaceae bacterium]
MKKTLRKPENWQDFESLCKKLWGEIWACPEIKKNGRSGQTQHGVDVYGMPKGETEYWGIQCKGKDDYTNSALSEKEIDGEIEKAKLFKPVLKKIYFATTANKDSKIEEYIRIKDIESRNSGLFEVHLFSWEDITDLIEENKNTFDWYVRNINHKVIHSALVTFHDDSTKLVFTPELIKNFIKYKLKPFEYSGSLLYKITPRERRKQLLEIATEPQPKRYYMNGMTRNRSSSVFSIRIKNTGKATIKNYKLYFEIVDEAVSADTVDKRDSFIDLFQYKYNTFFYKDSLKGIFEPGSDILVQKDTIRTDDICIRPIKEDPQLVELKWN